jgi:hypothetical protein
MPIRETLLKVAHRHPALRVTVLAGLRQAATPADFASLKAALHTAIGVADDLEGNFILVRDLLARGEARRLGRVSSMGVGTVTQTPERVTAPVRGTTDTYDVRITLAPHRGHHCTCPDWERNGRKVGPCKHVLALGLAWREQYLEPELEQMKEHLQRMLMPYGG